MAVFRIEKTRDYTVMSNHHLKDRTLTLKSKGLLSMICLLYTSTSLFCYIKQTFFPFFLAYSTAV